MSARTLDRLIYGIGAASGLGLALASVICLIKGIDAVVGNVLYAVYGLIGAYIAFKGWRDASRKGGTS